MPNENQHDDFYRSLRARVKTWAAGRTGGSGKWMEYVLTAPDLFYLLVKLTLEPEVPLRHKGMLAVAVAYFVSPIDLIPDFIPIAGMLDDISLAAYVLNEIINDVNGSVVQRHWAGEGDLLGLIQQILRKANQMIGSGLWRKIRDKVEKPRSKQ